MRFFKRLLFCLFGLVPSLVYAEVFHIDNTELVALKKEGVIVIDVRTPEEWKNTGVISGSGLHMFFDAQGRSDPVEWLAEIKKIAKPSDPIILICRSGNRSRVVADFLSREGGYQRVYNAKLGMQGWIREGLPVVPAP